VSRPEWGIARAETGRTSDGFMVLWLELGPLQPRLAAR